MIRVLIPLLFLALGLGAGVAAGLALRPAGQPATAEQAEADAPAPEPEASPAAAPGPAATGSTEFVRLNNQFVVPVVRDGSVRSLVVMALTVEILAGNNEAVFDREPRLRDTFLQVLFAHANAGGFDGSFTQAAVMDPLRGALGDAARQVLGDIVRDVLIVDITRQDA